MIKIRHPILFSESFGIDPKKLDEAGAADILLNYDTPLFIDPMLLVSNHRDAEICRAAEHYDAYFKGVLNHLARDDRDGAMRLLQSPEQRSTSLGYGKASNRGNGIGPGLAQEMLNVASDFFQARIVDPRMFGWIGLFCEGIGADRISDMTTNVILRELAQFTARVSKSIGIAPERMMKMYVTDERGSTPHTLPRNPMPSDADQPVLLCPGSILRRLPIAASHEELRELVTAENRELRRRINTYILKLLAQPNVSKRELRELLAEDPHSRDALIEAIKSLPLRPYDAARDPYGHLTWKRSAAAMTREYDMHIAQRAPRDAPQALGLVRQIVDKFKVLVEECDLDMTFWYECGPAQLRPRSSEFAQKLFFAVADGYLVRNSVSRLIAEACFESGPISFLDQHDREFVRVAVETSGRQVHTLVRIYEELNEWAREDRDGRRALFLLVNVGDMDLKDERLSAARDSYGRTWAADVIHVDADPL